MIFIEKIFNELGNYGPVILFIRTLIFLRKKKTLFYYYLFGFFINILFNQILKKCIQEPRPSVDSKSFAMAMKYAKSKNYLGSLKDDLFGMPSGHSQSVLFSTVFVFLTMKKENTNLILFYLVISLITLIQRVKYMFHTVNQVIVGSIIGILFAYIVYYIASNKIMGKLTEKDDDGGPL